MFDLQNTMNQVSALLVFAEGVLSFLSPCVLPLLPLYMGYLAGQNEEGQNSQKKIFVMTLCFIFGIFSAIMLMNVSVFMLSGFFQKHMDMFVRIGGGLIIILGLHQLGVFQFKSLSRTFKLPFHQTKSMNIFVAFAMGFTFSFAWTPCIGPALSSVLLLANSASSLWVSTYLMLLYATGFTIPFLILGLFTNKALNWMKKHQSMMNVTVKIGAVLLIVIGCLMISGKMNLLAGSVQAENTLPQAEVQNEEKPQNEPPVEGEGLRVQLLNQHNEIVNFEDYRGKVVFLNFWATWCPPCRQELPDIQKLYEKYKDSDEVAVLTVVFPGGRELRQDEFPEYLKENGYSMPVLFDDGTLTRYFQISRLPTTFMLDKEGKPYGYVSAMLSPEMMEDIIRQTLEGEKQ